MRQDVTNIHITTVEMNGGHEPVLERDGKHTVVKGNPKDPVKTPTGRLGMLPSSLQERRPGDLQIPQPGGWGFFTLAYRKCGRSRCLRLE